MNLDHGPDDSWPAWFDWFAVTLFAIAITVAVTLVCWAGIRT